MSQLNVVVLFGGCSPEHEVSLQSAAAVLRNLDRERFCPLPVGISRKGDWFLFSGSEAAIEDGSWLSLPECAPCALLPDRSARALLVRGPQGARQLPLDPVSGAMAGDTAAEQAEQSIRNLSAILEAAGMTLDDVVKTTVLLADIADFAAVNEVYAKHFTGAVLPARAAFAVRDLPKGAKVEIELVAYKG